MSQSLAEALGELQQSSGLMMAAVVGSDGLVIDAASDAGVDAESICSVAANGLLMMDALSQELGASSAKMLTLEYENDIVLLSPLDQDSLLVLLAGAGTNLGRLRIVMRRAGDGLRAAMATI